MTPESPVTPQALKARSNAQRTPFETLVDRASARIDGHLLALANLVGFVVWIAINCGAVPQLAPFDPPPFSLLGTLASLEAILIATLVLAAQHRAARIAELRAELDLHVNLVAERESTKLLALVSQLAERAGIDVQHDRELRELLAPTDVRDIEQTLAAQIEPTRP